MNLLHFLAFEFWTGAGHEAFTLSAESGSLPISGTDATLAFTGIPLQHGISLTANRTNPVFARNVTTIAAINRQTVTCTANTNAVTGNVEAVPHTFTSDVPQTTLP